MTYLARLLTRFSPPPCEPVAFSVGCMPEPQFKAEDYVNPEAPEGERRLRPDHPRVRDRSYDYARSTQEIDLWKASLVSTVMEPWDAYPDLKEIPEDAVPGPSLMLFIKERRRGAGYVADFLYKAADLPVTVHGILANEGSGLGVIELELWRPRWGYWDDFGDFVGPREEEAPARHRGRGRPPGGVRADHQ